MPPFAGMRFGRYELVARLGAGGMGEVWRARDHDLQREVAIKLLPERFAADPLRMGRFTQEARAASSLNHPNIVTIHDSGEAEGLPYLVMELVDGQTLRELVPEGRPLPLRRALDIASHVADGLAKAHAAGIVHRDLKPENVMVTRDGFVKILDFGLAKLRTVESAASGEAHDSGADTWPESPSPQTAAGVLLGTVGYMSPEQARSRPVDYRSDQFALGAILYELVTGRQAFRRETAAQTLAAIIEDPPVPIATLNPQVPPPLRWVIENRCLAKEPGERYESTQDLARELRDLRERPSLGSDASAPHAPAPPGAERWRRAGRAAAAVLVLVGLAWGAYALWRHAWERTGLRPGRPLVVAVLPITNLTGEPRNEAAAAGIAQVVVDSLSQVDGLEVLPRASTIAYAERKGDLPAVAHALDAAYLVDGVLQSSQNRLRVSLSLVRASSKSVEWGDTFDGAFPEVFELQSRVADGVARAARLRLSSAARNRIEARPTASPSAWEEYTAALALVDRADRPGNLEAAVGRLEQALRADPRFARAHALLARVCLDLYDQTHEVSWADRARDVAQEALRLAPQDVEVRRSLAETLASRGRIAEATDELKQALALKPDSDETHRRYALLLADAGQPDAALAQARQAVELRGGYWKNQMALGWVNYAAGRWSEAAAAYRRATELAPDNAWAFQMLGTSLHQQGDLKGAVAPYQEAIRLAADSRAWSNLGYLYYGTGRLPEALHAYEEAARLEPRSATIHRGLGDVRARLGQAAAGRREWKSSLDLSRQALQVNPRDERQLKNAAICLAKLGERQAALDQAAAALAAGPSSPETHYGAAVVHALTGDAQGALALLAKALVLGASATLAQQDDDLALLRGKPEFQKLLERAAKPAGR